MARPKHEKATIIKVDIMKMISRIIGMSDADLAKWTRKALQDLTEGCISDDVDDFVKECYEKSIEAMQNRQKTNAQNYRLHHAKNGQETNSLQEASTRKDEDELTHAGNGALRNLAPSCRQPLPLAESALCATSGATALEDGDIREDSQNTRDCSDAALLESGTSSKTFTTTDATTPCTISTDGPRQAEDRQSRRTGGDSLRRVEKRTASHAETLPVRSAAEEKKPYGTCGHVMLTDTEGRHLREVYGNNLSTAIDILDAYIENGGKAAKKYKNHAAVLRKGNWVYEKVQTMALNEKRIENASKGPRNWKAEERERTARVLRGESADGKGYVRDDELTPAELEAKYG